MARILHELCQPLTTLQCRLEMADISRKPEDYHDAVAVGLAECARLTGHVLSLRELVRALRSAAAR